MNNKEELSIVIKAKDRASATLDRISLSSKNIKDAFSKMAKVAATAAVATGVALVGLGTKAITAAVQFEQTQVAFNTMLGSAEKGTKLLKELGDLAATTPFEINQVRDAAKQLLAYGIAEEDIIDTTRMLGDVSAGLGVQTFPQLALAFGQIKSKGKLMGQEMLQLTNAGFNVAEAFGVTRSELQEMMDEGEGVTFEQVEEAFRKATSEGGRFNNMMENQSKTIGGRVSNIKDKITLAFEQIGLKMLPTANKIIDFIERTATKFSEWWPKIRDVAIQVGNFLKPAVDDLSEALKNDLGPQLRELMEALKPLLPVIGVALVIAVRVLIGALAILVTVISKIIGLFLWVRDRTQQVRNVFFALMGTIGSLANRILTLPKSFRDAANGMISAVSPVLGVFGRLLDMAQMVGRAIGDVVNRAGSIGNIVGIGGERANGGQVSSGTPYVVGERGPEVFVPNTQGRVVDNQASQGMGGAVTTNIYGNMSFANQGDIDYFMDKLNKQQRLAKVGM